MKNFFYICPSTDPIGPENENYIENLLNYIQILGESGADFIHCDIMDGIFVERTTYSYDVLQKIKSNTTVPLDVHLMTKLNKKETVKFCECGANILTLHIEHFIKNGKIQKYKLKKYANLIKKHNTLCGIAIKPLTDVNILINILKYVDFVLIMSVEPGKSGQKFMSSAYDKVKVLNEVKVKKNMNYLIGVDGGIIPEVSKKLINLGANFIVSGSYVFNSLNKKDAIDSLKS